MALVAYSDSEGSDEEGPAAPNPDQSSTGTTKTAAFQKLPARKIQVDLPAPQAETAAAQSDRPAKRARTGGAFGGFNSLLPAPKRTAAQSAPGRGVSLKTSSEAAFSRQPAISSDAALAADDTGLSAVADEVARDGGVEGREEAPMEATKVGKATKFKPLSVQGGRRKKKAVVVSTPPVQDTVGVTHGNELASKPPRAMKKETGVETAVPPSKPKMSMFSLPEVDNAHVQLEPPGAKYESFTTQPQSPEIREGGVDQPQPQFQPAANSLQALTQDLNLTAAERRQLFGRNGKGGDVNIARFDMDAEYASNEVLRQSGEMVEHKAVKSIAPGKHSLQQLVNNARSQQENLEDKWAEGRRERGEGGGRYGWGK